MCNLEKATSGTQYVQQAMRCSFNIIISFICMDASEKFPLKLFFQAEYLIGFQKPFYNRDMSRIQMSLQENLFIHSLMLI